MRICLATLGQYAVFPRGLPRLAAGGAIFLLVCKFARYAFREMG